MYIIGGYAGRLGYSMDIIVYDFNTGKSYMQEASGRPTFRSAHTAVEYNNQIYVFGGWDGKDTNNHFFKYNITKNTWKKVKHTGKKPAPRRSHCAARCDNKMYIFGGFDGKNNLESSLYSFDFDKKKWTAIKMKGEPPSPRSRSRMICYYNKVAIIGGWNRMKHFNDWYEFNLESKCWSKKKVRLPYGDGFGQHSIVVKNNRMFIYGGYDSLQKTACSFLWGYFLGYPNAS